MELKSIKQHCGLIVYILAHVPLLISAIAIITYNFDQPFGEDGKYAEGDMMLDPEQLSLLTDSNRRVQRDNDLLWPNGNVYYYFDNVTADMKSRVTTAMCKIEKEVSCVRFITQQDKDKRSTGCLRITDKNRSCASTVGYASDRLSKMNVHRKGCRKLGIIMHELLHALGMYHTHTNYNRDKYVGIRWDNIQQRFRKNFEKLQKQLAWEHNLDYDYNSIMHYGTYFFSKNKKPTIVPFDVKKKIGQRTYLSPIDIQKLKKLYCVQHEG